MSLGGYFLLTVSYHSQLAYPVPTWQYLLCFSCSSSTLNICLDCSSASLDASFSARNIALYREPLMTSLAGLCILWYCKINNPLKLLQSIHTYLIWLCEWEAIVLWLTQLAPMCLCSQPPCCVLPAAAVVTAVPALSTHTPSVHWLQLREHPTSSPHLPHCS